MIARIFDGFFLLISLLLSASIMGCTSPADEKFFPESASPTIGPAGDTIQFSLADGTEFEIAVPAGGVPAATRFKFTTQEPVAGQRFNILLRPRGLAFAPGLPSTVTIRLPSDHPLTSAGGVFYDSYGIPYETLPDGRLRVSIARFAGSPDTTPSLGKHASSGTSLSAVAEGCGDAPELSTNEGLAAVNAVDIEVYGQCMVVAINALAESGAYADAVILSGRVAAFLQRTGLGDAAAIIDQASSLACAAYSSALEEANSQTVTGMSVMYHLVTPVLFWETMTQKMGVTCDGIPAGAYQDAVNKKVGEAITFYERQKAALASAASAGYADAKAEAKASVRAGYEVLSLDPPREVAATVETEIASRAQPALFDAMIQPAWNRAAQTGDYDELIFLAQTLDSSERIGDATQYCGTAIRARTVDTSGTFIDSLPAPLGGIRAGEKSTAAALRARRNGRVELSGLVRPLGCPENSTGGEESLVLSLDGAEIRTLTATPYFQSRVVIDLGTTLPKPAADSPREALLTISRKGRPCGGFWGDNPDPLAGITLTFSPSKIVFARKNHIYAMNDDGTDSVQLTSGSSIDGYPAWSPDRTEIAFSRHDAASANDNIWIMKADGGAARQLTFFTGNTMGEARAPAWSPDGSKIAFHYQFDFDTTYGTRIDAINTDGSGLTTLRQLLRSGDRDTYPAWSPDGAKIAFARYDGTLSSIAIMKSDGSGTILASTRPAAAADSDPSWSPTGDIIAFSRTDNSQGSSVFTMKPDASGEAQLSAFGFDHPVWSPDGARLAITGLNSQTGEYEITVITSGGTGPRILGPGVFPAW